MREVFITREESKDNDSEDSTDPTSSFERGLISEAKANRDEAHGNGGNDEIPRDDQQRTPVTEDCSSESIPDNAEDEKGTHKVLVPVVESMAKYLFKNYRLPMYSFVNHLLKTGQLSEIVGTRVRNKIFNASTLNFPDPGVTFWRIDREDFYADVNVRLVIQTNYGNAEWIGILVFWCSFPEEGNFECDIVNLTQNVDRKEEGLTLLSSYLVPIHTNTEMDIVAAGIWKRYDMEDALTNVKARNAEKLAKAQGLNIEYHPIYDHKGVDSILFFVDDDLVVGKDKIEDGPKGKVLVRDKAGKSLHIPAKTIVINTNRIGKDYSTFNIFHECIHYEEHYLFFRLQQMGNNDPRRIDMIEMEVEKGKEIKDPVYFMEKQANRGAYGLLMPAAHTRCLIQEELSKTDRKENTGARFEKAGIQVARTLGVPHFRMRARMIQLGFVEAKGALNYVERRLIAPFSFDIDAWRCEQHTFVITESRMNGLLKNNEDFQKIMATGKFIYADGHVIRDSERFVRYQNGRYVLTDEALSKIDACCLRFVKVYVQNYIGRYVFGRMYYDADYLAQNEFYLNDLINQGHMDEFDARQEYINRFPSDFKEAVKMLLKTNDSSIAKLAEYLSMDDATLGRWLSDKKYYRNEDFLTMLCLFFKLPDWISKLVFKRARFALDDDDKRLFYLKEILRSRSNDGLDAANDYLKSHGAAALHIG